MQRLATILNALFRLAEVSALIALAWLAISVNRAIHEATASMVAIQHVAEALPSQVLAEAHGQLSGARADMAKQLTETNKILDRHLAIATGSLYREIEQARIELTGQTGAVTKELSSTLQSANRVVSDPGIPALLRDSRQTVAITGVAMSHFREVADVAAREAPAMAKSANSIAASAAGVTGDIHVLTTDLTKPRPWYRKILSYVGDGVKIGGVFF